MLIFRFCEVGSWKARIWSGMGCTVLIYEASKTMDLCSPNRLDGQSGWQDEAYETIKEINPLPGQNTHTITYEIMLLKYLKVD